jgi:hypothetical protein
MEHVQVGEESVRMRKYRTRVCAQKLQCSSPPMVVCWLAC